MAFDQPLEADKVDDNLFFSLIKGTLMWIIGDDEDDKKRQDEELRRGLRDMMLDDSCSSSHAEAYESRGEESTLPRLVRSDVSVAGEHNQPDLLPRCQGAASFDGKFQNTFNYYQRAEKKKMSWSDNLVEYMDDEVSSHFGFIVTSYKLLHSSSALSCWLDCWIEHCFIRSIGIESSCSACVLYSMSFAWLIVACFGD
jgi:hypothetical protein